MSKSTTRPKSCFAPAFARVVVRSLMWLVVLTAPATFGASVSEPPDFPNATAGPATTLSLGANVFSGTLNSSGDTQDRFNVTVPAGFRLSQATKTFAAGGGVQSPNVSFNNEDLSGTGAGTFVSGYPLGPGTYSAIVSVGFSVGNAWTVTFVLEPLPNYSVTRASGAITVTDDSGNGDTLNVTQPAGGSIKFAAAGRTFSVNNGPLLTNDSGNVSLSGIDSVTINAGAGHDTINIGALGTSFPGLVVNGGTGDDTVNLNGSIAFALDKGLSVDLQNDDANPGVDSVNIAAGTVITTSGLGPITLKCSRNVTMSTGASLQSSYGSITIEANQQAVATTGNFIGVHLDGASIFCGGWTVSQNQITVKGRGGNDPGGGQLGVYVVNGATITGGQRVNISVTGTGGASTNWINRGVTVYGSGSAIRTIDGTMNVTGTGGPNSSAYGIGVSVIWGGQLIGAGGAVNVTGTGAGAPGGGLNRGVELSEAGSRITSSSGIVVSGSGGPGGSSGLYMDNSSAITTPAEGGNIAFLADNVSIDGTALIVTTNTASQVSFAPAAATHIDLGGPDASGTLGLSDAELDRVFTANLIIDGRGIADIKTTSPITRSAATGLNLVPASGGFRASSAGTDLALGTGTVKLSGPFSCPIAGALPDSDFAPLRVVGGVDLNNVILDLSGTTHIGAEGNAFTIVDNDGADPVVGTFAGLPEGAYLAWPGSPALNARISYLGGDGNDVVLTLASAMVIRNTSGGTNVGSIRSALAAAAAVPGPNTVTFDPSLNAQAIILTNQIEVLDADGVTLDGTAMTSGFGFSGSGVSRIIQNLPGSTLSLKGFVFINGNGTGTNGYGDSGGAIVNNGTMAISRCTFYNNAVLILGGAVYNSGALAMTNCTFAANSAAALGGAIYNAGSLSLTHCTLSANFSSLGGGGICNESGNTAAIANCIVSANTGSPGADIRNFGTVNFSGANLMAGLAGTAATGSSANPAAPLLAALGGYGGNTTTMALLPGSPARNASVGSSATTDQRGFPVVGVPDIGAYESGTPRTYATWVVESFPTNSTPTQRAGTNDFDGDGRVNAAEYAAMSDPTAANSMPFLSLALNATRTIGTNIFVFRPGALDLTYELSRSTNLSSWTNILTFTSATTNTTFVGPGVAASATGNLITVTDTNITGQPKTFYRLNTTVGP